MRAIGLVFAQYRNNGFAAHRRCRQAPVEREREPGGGGQRKLVRDLFLERHQRQLQFCHATKCLAQVWGLGGFCRPNPFPGSAYGTGYTWSSAPPRQTRGGY